MRVLKVELGDRSYDIAIGHTIASSELKKFCAAQPQVSKIFAICDNNIPTSLLDDILSFGKEIHRITLPKSAEENKTFSVVEELMDKILSLKPDRNCLLIAVGGGVTGDLTGFIASILLRGVSFIQIPTTLLSMVDSSVGGKTGINTAAGKNMVGTFYQPKLVCCDTKMLESLPLRELNSGYAEIVKHAFLESEIFERLQQDISLEEIIYDSVKVKAKIVGEDEMETGVRATLNFGHTFAHALEKCKLFKNKILHGEAVAVGMVMACKFAEQKELTGKLEKLLTKFSLPKNVAELADLAEVKLSVNGEEIIELMKSDKKNYHGKINLILPVKKDDKIWLEKQPTEEERVREFLKGLL